MTEVEWPSADEQSVDMRQVLPADQMDELAASVRHALGNVPEGREPAEFAASYVASRFAVQAHALEDARLQVRQAGKALAESMAASIQVAGHRVWLREKSERQFRSAQRLREELAAAQVDAERFRSVVEGECPRGVHAGWSVAAGHLYVCPCLLDDLRRGEADRVRVDARKADRRDPGLRQRVYDRDGRCCRYCGSGPLERGMAKSADRRRVLAFDHVDPNLPAGLDAENFVTACAGCQEQKGDRTPAEAGMELRPVPSLEGLADDLPASEAVRLLCDLLSLVGVTATGGQVNAWTLHQRRLAEEWAIATHLSASDNPVEVPSRPGFLDGVS